MSVCWLMCVISENRIILVAEELTYSGEGIKQNYVEQESKNATVNEWDSDELNWIQSSKWVKNTVTSAIRERHTNA